MTLKEIKAALAAGHDVHWKNKGYRVIKDSIGQYLICWNMCGPDANYIGLTWLDGETLNGKPSDFFVAKKQRN